MIIQENLLPCHLFAPFFLISNEEFVFLTALINALIQISLDLQHVEWVLIALGHYSSPIDEFATIYEPVQKDRSTAAEIWRL